MAYRFKIPHDRIGVMIGKNGETLRKLEMEGKVRVDIDSETGEVIILDDKAGDTYLAYRMRDVLKAIGRGFSPEHGMLLFKDEIYYEEFDIREYVGKSNKRIMQVRSRLIGTDGRTRRLIEEHTDCLLSIKGNTIALIGDLEGLKVASKAVTMILSGSEHSSVYSFMEKKRKDLKISRWGF